MKRMLRVLLAVSVCLALPLASWAASLTLAQVADINSMDPQKISDIYSANVIRQIYSNLVQINEVTEIVPDLAESWENPDERTWVFHLRKGVKFHNGEPFTAADVKYTFERVLDPATASPGRTHLRELESMEVVDDHTIKLVTKRPYAPMLMSLSRYETAIVNEKAVKELGADYGLKGAVGTGPFVFESWSRGDKVTLKRNEGYFRGPAKLDALIYRGIPEDATRLVELRSGGIDLIPSAFPFQDYAGVEKEGKFTMYRSPVFSTLYMGLNTEVKPFDNKKVRQAMNYAVDKVALCEAVYFGLGAPSRGPLSPVIWGFDKSLEPVYPYDVEKAKALLKEAGFPNGFEMTIYTDNRTERRNTAEFIQAYLMEAGIQANIEVMEWGALLSTSSKGVNGAFMLGWTGTGDADGGIGPVYDSANIGSSNRFRFKHDKIDELIRKGAGELDSAKRMEIYKELQAVIIDECPLVFVISQEMTGASSKAVKNYKLYPNMINPMYEVFIEE